MVHPRAINRPWLIIKVMWEAAMPFPLAAAGSSAAEPPLEPHTMEILGRQRMQPSRATQSWAHVRCVLERSKVEPTVHKSSTNLSRKWAHDL